MSTYAKALLSASTNGEQIQVAATSSPGTLVHTARAVTGSSFDEVWLWATNTSGSAVSITVEYGTTGAANQITVSIPSLSGLTPIIPGLILQNALTVKVFAVTTNVVNVSGFINQYN